MKEVHTSVLIEEFLSFFAGRKLVRFVDGTLGMGGHARALLEAHPEVERFIGIDRDPAALEKASQVLEPWKNKVELIHGNYADMEWLLEKKGISCVEGIFLDVGVSSMQLDEEKRGFSFMREGPLDMRMDPSSELSAARVVNQWSEKELGDIFRELGEEPKWRKVAKTIVIARRKKRIETTSNLVEILLPVLGRGKRKKLHPATLVFQALRIYVNKELESLEKGIEGAVRKLCLGGRLGIISFHRLEDRIVKGKFKEDKRLEVLTKKPISPTFLETKKNRRARSAKMRFAQKIEEGQVDGA